MSIRQELSRSLSKPDVRPAMQTQLSDAALSICRICRGEGTAAEPLFYPCKCSGSIKYVHQDCLMEWLSHSQKKHCELCKTSFRFTKLYAPEMPQSLPVHVFLEHMTKYLIRHALVWLRAALTINVWLFWLPYFMRAVWSFVFWVSDDGLVGSAASNANSLNGTAYDAYFARIGEGTCPASPLFVPDTTPVTAASAILNSFAPPSLTELIKRFALALFGISHRAEQSTTSDVSANGSVTIKAGHPNKLEPSLLSEVGFIKNLTGAGSMTHQTVVSVLEGQLITVLVVLTFILVILVRDYVVQQQPEINMRAAFAAPEDAAPNEEQVAPVAAEPVNEDRRHDSDSDEETLDDGETDPLTNGALTDINTEDVAEVAETTEAIGSQQAELSQTGSSPVIIETPQPGTSDGSETNSDQARRVSANEYMRIFRQARGDPQEVLRIADEEGKRESVEFWANGAKTWSKDPEESSATGVDRIDGFPQTLPTINDDRPFPEPWRKGTFGSIGIEAEDDGETDLTAGKGKQPAYSTPPLLANEFNGSSAGASPRPRSVSEGPSPPSSSHPLASNNWSFDPLSTEAADTNGHALQHPERNASPSGSVYSEADYDEPTLAEDLIPDDPSIDATLPLDPVPELGEPAEPVEPLPVANAVAIEHGVAEEPDPANAPPAGIIDKIANFMWGGLDDEEPVDEEAAAEGDGAGDEAAEAGQDDGWINVPAAQAFNDMVDNEVDGVDEGEAGAAGLDPEVIDDMDDFDGIMELIGMRGPLAGLFQNAIFCSVLVSASILSCIFFPYNTGRAALWVLANPMRLVRMLFEVSKLIQDAAVTIGGFISWCALNFADLAARPFGTFVFSRVVTARKGAWSLWTTALGRVLGCVFMDFPMSASEMQNFSAISHEALLVVKAQIYRAFSIIPHIISICYEGGFACTLELLWSAVQATHTTVLSLSALLLNPSAWVIDLSEPERTSAVDPALSSWSAVDRFWAILTGYLTIFLIAAVYLKRGTPFTRGNVMEVWEAGVIDTLHQASGIMKVIFIISIEMLVFPLYCGLLLDAALLPLFEGASFKSRMLFTYNFPATSIFVHWFVGTGYMFHFALFVAMCRKIMRPGVLYFIRDPDDPEYHPVRDVLERNLAIQLRKILFSAFVYGTLVIVCLGGVVWGLAFATTDVLPIHYSSNEPVLEFPVDLLFYNFFMPLAVNLLKPRDALYVTYTWWFRKCARALRLTYFLFGERRIDEEGTLHLSPRSHHQRGPVYRKALLELDEKNEVIPKTWRDTFEGGKAKPNPPLQSKEMKTLRHKKAHLVETGQITKDGRFVRAPASDRVKIPKGKKVFLTVTERDHRKDDRPDDDLYASNQYQVVYIPPHFRSRIFAFIVLIWIFAAVTGVGCTIVPLVVGRKLFQELMPDGIRTNDVYAFSIGVYVLGLIGLALFRMRGLERTARAWLDQARTEIREGRVAKRIASICLHVGKLLYTYSFIVLVLPLLASALLELYIVLPLNTYMHPPTPSAAAQTSTSQNDNNEGLTQDPDRHTVRVIQSWTLGLLYLKLGTRIITSLFPDSRPAAAVRRVFSHGILHPDVSVLTRAFILPGLLLSLTAIFGPPYITSLLFRRTSILTSGQPIANEAAEAVRVAVIYRNSYPVACLCALTLRNAVGLVGVFKGWTARIKDEAYLIGERLHNFGAAKAGGDRRARGAFRAGGPRL